MFIMYEKHWSKSSIFMFREQRGQRGVCGGGGVPDLEQRQVALSYC